VSTWREGENTWPRETLLADWRTTMLDFTTRIMRKMAVFAIVGSGMVFGHGGCIGDDLDDILDDIEDIVDDFDGFGGHHDHYYDDYYYEDYYYEDYYYDEGVYW
jgi:hypothetical protein